MDRKHILGLVSGGVVLTLVLATWFGGSIIFGGEEEVYIIDFDHERAAIHVRELCSNGPRMSGSEEERLGAEYIAAQFKDAGLEEVHIETYSVPMFEVRNTRISLVEYGPLGTIPRPLGDTITFEHMTEYVFQGYSGSYNWRDFRDDLDVVSVGNGTDESAYSSARGRVCLIEQNGDTPPNSEVYFDAYDAGAEAIILQNTWRGESLGYLPMFKSNQNPVEYDDYPDIPFFMVSKEMGDTILQMTPTHRLRMDIDIWIGNLDISVVVGDIPSSGSSDDIIMFTAHHDTCYNTIGAVDNTVGPASLIEIARGMVDSGKKFSRTVRFATFGGEEEGLFGSKEYEKAHRAELGENLQVLNFDMAHTDREAMSVSMVSNCNTTLGKLKEIGDQLLRVEPALKDYTIGYGYNDLQIPYSDYWPFVQGGSMGVAAWGSGCVEYHTYLDDMTHLNSESMQIEGRILGSYALAEAT
ncbi:MAG: M28 family peptidase [Thermoplasmata archaeon]|nr:M28 family peptidase [Thermoplasmata archaeon]